MMYSHWSGETQKHKMTKVQKYIIQRYKDPKKQHECGLC